MPDVIFEKRDNGVAFITLNRPDSLNAMGGDLMPLLAQHLDECRWDGAVRCVVLTGAGRAFCAGGDVKNMAAQGAAGGDGKRSPAASFAYGVDELRESQRRTSYTLHTMPKPTIAMVNGHAVGAGLSLALACDIRIASDRAKFGTVFRNVGFSGDFGGSYFLQRLVGNERARLLYFTGQILEADEAQRIGMVSKVVPQDDLERGDDGDRLDHCQRPCSRLRPHEGEPEPRRDLRLGHAAGSGGAQHAPFRHDTGPPRGRPRLR